MPNKNVTIYQTQPSEKLAIDIEAAAWRLSVSPSFIRLEIRRGRIGVVRVGRRLLITHTELERYVKANTSKVSDG